MKYIGIGIGSSNIKVTVLENNKEIDSRIVNHDGDIKGTLVKTIHELHIKEGKAVVTGVSGRKYINLPNFVEAQAFETGLEYLNVKPDAIVTMGGEDLIVYTMDTDGHVLSTLSGDKCASGTGEFYKQQLLRMNLKLDDTYNVGKDGKVLHLASRCSVFMKSDCTHKLNKNEATKADIIMSLSNVMANKVVDFLVKAKITQGRVVLLGGVTKNIFMIELLKKALPKVEFIVPKQAAYFESFGASLMAEKYGKPLPKPDDLITKHFISFGHFEPLQKALNKVNYIPNVREEIDPNAEYILGIDGGSTTTKVTLVNYKTEKIVASYYGRTHGNPIEALRNCLIHVKEDIKSKLGDKSLNIVLASTTGSSREILGVFTETPGVYNEIIAHSVGTTHFKKNIDTIFEIGGQDAKYVHLQNGVPIDYAMNEACSAGTGSFLEESAHGDLNIDDAKLIGDIAMRSTGPLKYGEHCSAFINSDIRRSIQEGATQENITAGIVFSIVANYLNRVVGNRYIGQNIVLQGGVAKNKAVPVAFAYILDKNITVPPDPELLGAFGVALLAKQKYEAGLLEKGEFDINIIITRKIEYGKSFICKSCENNCPIMTIIVNEHKYFFGGRCNKYTNMRKKITADDAVDYVDIRNNMIFNKFAADFSKMKNNRNITVGVPRVFSIYNLWPLYSWFFYELGVNCILSEKIIEEGVQKVQAPFCFPGELAHGAVEDILSQDIDYIFLPHFKRMPSYENDVHATLCPVTQALPYYIKIAFDLEDDIILRPLIDFEAGYEEGYYPFIEMGKKLGVSEIESKNAFLKGVEQYKAYLKEAAEIGRKVVEDAEKNNTVIITLLGRSYNAFTKDANMGIPLKFRTRNYSILPYDFVPFTDDPISDNMYWYYGQQDLKAARTVKKYKNLFICYISNFSCAPDSFILHIVRWFMGSKPFLILELDAHSADAGIDTRIEAFLDIIEGYRHAGNIQEHELDLDIQITTKDNKLEILKKSTQEKFKITDKNIKLVLPSMGDFSTEISKAAASSEGITAISLPVADQYTTQLAKNVASGKECIPTLLVLGQFLKFMQSYKKPEDEILILVAAETTGPCRTGQYAYFYRKTLASMGYRNIGVFAPSSDNSYTELGPTISKSLWWAIVIGDYMTDIYRSLLLTAEDKEYAESVFFREWKNIVKAAYNKNKKHLKKALRHSATELKKIKLKRQLKDLPKVLIVGEIFVRRDDFSVKELIDHLTKNGIFGKVANVSEWIYYTDFVKKIKYKRTKKFRKGLSKFINRDLFHILYVKYIEGPYKHIVEHFIEKTFEPTHLITEFPHNMKEIVEKTHEFTIDDFETEANLSSGVGALAIEKGYSGVAAIMPFACMPGRIIKSFLEPYSRKKKFPFIALENDSMNYPPSILNKLDIFSLNVKRYHKKHYIDKKNGN